MTVTIKAWLSIGSTYTYLTALRLRSVVKVSEIELDIRPISIRQIMKNMDNIPFPPSKKLKWTTCGEIYKGAQNFIHYQCLMSQHLIHSKNLIGLT